MPRDFVFLAMSSMSSLFARPFRCCIRVTRWLRSTVYRRFICIAFPDCRIKRSVTIGSGVIIRATDGGRIHIGSGCTISRGCELIAKSGSIKIGDNTFVGRDCILVANDSIEIGDDCLIAEMVVVRDQNHRTERGSGLIRDQGMVCERVHIGDNVWVGAKSTLLKGAKVGSSCVIGAHSLVLGEIEEGMLAFGSPATSKRLVVS